MAVIFNVCILHRAREEERKEKGCLGG